MYQNNGLWLQFMYFISETHYNVSEQWIVTTFCVFYFRDSLQCIRTMDCDYSFVFYFRDSLQCIRTMDCDYSLCILFQRLITVYQNNGLWLQFMLNVCSWRSTHHFGVKGQLVQNFITNYFPNYYCKYVLFLHFIEHIRLYHFKNILECGKNLSVLGFLDTLITLWIRSWCC